MHMILHPLPLLRVSRPGATVSLEEVSISEQTDILRIRSTSPSFPNRVVLIHARHQLWASVIAGAEELVWVILDDG